jgi:predicted dehydrogenase
MKEVRVAVIGVGIMGSSHAQRFEKGEIEGATLAAICDIDPAVRAKWSDRVPVFASADDLIAAKAVDAVVIATPHYFHTTIGIAALRAGLHVLVEKPISVHKADCERLIAAHRGRKQVFSAMFQQRTEPHYQRLRNLIQRGELGEFLRFNWIITNWFRSEAYYASGGWRATWRGEGGGVLMNQCPHNLDMLQWLVGMPKRVRAFCRFGRYHDIEVEDDVTAYMEFPNGATGLFITTTGEAPGTNRLEIVGTRGKLVAEHGRLSFTRNEIPCDEFCRTTPELFGKPPVWNVDIPVSGEGGGHRAILQNFIDAIREGQPLIAPAREGQKSVELANAMLLSTWTDRTVELPFSGAVFERHLKKLIAKSRLKKSTTTPGMVDLDASFNR